MRSPDQPGTSFLAPTFTVCDQAYDQVNYEFFDKETDATFDWLTFDPETLLVTIQPSETEYEE